MPVSLAIGGSITIADSELDKLKAVFTGPLVAPEDMIAKPAPVAPSPVAPAPAPVTPLPVAPAPVTPRPPTGPILMPDEGFRSSAPPSGGSAPKPAPPSSGGGGGGPKIPSYVCSPAGDRLAGKKIPNGVNNLTQRLTYDDPNGLNEWEGIELSDGRILTKEEWSDMVMIQAGAKPAGFGMIDCSAGCPPDIGERIKNAMLANNGKKIYITKRNGQGDSCPTGIGRMP